jgi:hypothetical protein
MWQDELKDWEGKHHKEFVKKVDCLDATARVVTLVALRSV